MFYVYIYKNPENGLPFYVGKGTKLRFRRHLFETWNNTTNKMRLSKIINIRSKQLEPIVEIVKDNLSEDEALELESYLIQKYGKIIDGTGILTNILDGGQQPPKGVGNPDWKTNNPSTRTKGMSYEERYGIERAKILKEGRSKSLKGRTFSPETIQLMRIAASKRDHTRRCKKIHTPFGIFDSVKEAAANLQRTSSAISQKLTSENPKHKDWYYL